MGVHTPGRTSSDGMAALHQGVGSRLLLLLLLVLVLGPSYPSSGAPRAPNSGRRSQDFEKHSPPLRSGHKAFQFEAFRFVSCNEVAEPTVCTGSQPHRQPPSGQRACFGISCWRGEAEVESLRVTQRLSCSLHMENARAILRRLQERIPLRPKRRAIGLRVAQRPCGSDQP